LERVIRKKEMKKQKERKGNKHICICLFKNVPTGEIRQTGAIWLLLEDQEGDEEFIVLDRMPINFLWVLEQMKKGRSIRCACKGWTVGFLLGKEGIEAIKKVRNSKEI
jgi:hypothetical protein